MSMCVVCPEGHTFTIAASRSNGTVICPCCFASFSTATERNSAWQARKEEGKSRRSRDDEDEEEDQEERPAKKAKAKKPKDEDEEEEPPRKKPDPKKGKKDDAEDLPRKKKKPRDQDEEEEEEEEDDDEEEDGEKEDEEKEPEEEEEPIEWTPRKRQLKVCANGLIAMLVGCYFLLAFTIVTSLAIDCFEFIDDWTKPSIGPFVFYWLAMPLLVVGMTAIVVALVMNLWVPGRAGARGSLITGLVFATLVYLIGSLTLLTLMGATVAERERADRFVGLLTGGCAICFVVTMVAAMGYLSQLMAFMKLHLDASQSITNIGFILLSFLLLLGLVYASPMLKSAAGDWMSYAVSLLAILVSGFAIRMLILQVFLIMKVRRTIASYIKDA